MLTGRADGGRRTGIWLLRSTRAWLPRDLEVLRPVFERMRAEGPDFLQRNAALANEVQRTFVDIDEIEVATQQGRDGHREGAGAHNEIPGEVGGVM